MSKSKTFHTLVPSEKKLVHPCLNLFTIRSGRFFNHPFSLNAITLDIEFPLKAPPVITKESSSLIGMRHPLLKISKEKVQ